MTRKQPLSLWEFLLHEPRTVKIPYYKDSVTFSSEHICWAEFSCKASTGQLCAAVQRKHQCLQNFHSTSPQNNNSRKNFLDSSEYTDHPKWYFTRGRLHHYLACNPPPPKLKECRMVNGIPYFTLTPWNRACWLRCVPGPWHWQSGGTGTGSSHVEVLKLFKLLVRAAGQSKSQNLYVKSSTSLAVWLASNSTLSIFYFWKRNWERYGYHWQVLKCTCKWTWGMELPFYSIAVVEEWRLGWCFGS